MLDSEKIELIKQMLDEFWSNGTVSEDGCIVLLNAIQTVADFKRN
jgi:hypothetical protein